MYDNIFLFPSFTRDFVITTCQCKYLVALSGFLLSTKTVDIKQAVEEEAITGHVLTKTSCSSVLLFRKDINFVTNFKTNLKSHHTQKHPQAADDITHKKTSVVGERLASILTEKLVV